MRAFANPFALERSAGDMKWKLALQPSGAFYVLVATFKGKVVAKAPVSLVLFKQFKGRHACNHPR